MKDTKKFDIVLESIDFSKENHEGIMMDRTSIEKLINSPEFRKLLESGHLLGLLSHEGRDRMLNERTKSLPIEDFIAKSPDLCNVMRDAWIEDNKLMIGVDFLDTEAAKRAKDLIRNGVKMGSSLSTCCDYNRQENMYECDHILGVDLTLDPSFPSRGIVVKNFSATDGSLKTILNLSAGVHFSDDIVNFSFQEFRREFARPLHLTLNTRIRDVIRWIKSAKEADLIAYKDVAKYYISDPINNWIAKAMQQEGIINIQYGLRLAQFMKDPKALTQFYVKINMIKKIYQKQKFFTRINQDILNSVLSDLFKSLFDYIYEKAGKNLDEIAANKGKKKTEVKKVEEPRKDDTNINHKKVIDVNAPASTGVTEAIVKGGK